MSKHQKAENPTGLAKVEELKHQIEVITRATAEIMACTDIGEVRQFIDMTEALKAVARRIRAGVHHHNAIASANSWARRRLGELLHDTPLHNGDPRLHDVTRLRDLGVSKIESHRCQAIAALPDAIFEGLIQRAIDSQTELSTKKLVDEGCRYLRERKKREMLAAGAGHMDGVGGESEWRIHRADCLEASHLIESGSVRLIFADPPYNIGVDYGDHYDDDREPAEYLGWCESWLSCCRDLLAPDGSLWLLHDYRWWGRILPIAEALGFHLRQPIIWYESFGVNCTRMFNRCSRPLWWLIKDRKHFVFNEDAPQIRRDSARLAEYNDPRANPLGKLWDDVWGFDSSIARVVGTAKERMPGFPTQLPLDLLRPVVACASDPGDLVVDPFCGSGTTGVACLELGRRFIGIERSEEFAELSRLRLAGASTPS
jgi:site-specific DNA-methyltransferase (adenine-specific)